MKLSLAAAAAAAYVVTVELCKRPLLRLIARPPRPRRGVVGVAA